MAEYVLNRNHTLRTTNGVITFVKGEPTRVPVAMERDAAAIGCIRADGADIDTSEPVPALKPVVQGVERQDDLYAAFEMLIERNDSKDFTGQGVPSVKAIEKIVGFDVDRTEVLEAWGEYKIAKAEAE